MLLIIKKGGAICKKPRNFTSVLSVSPIFFLMCSWGLALAMHAQCRVVDSDVHSHYFTNIAARNAAKQRIAKYHSQKSLSNSVRSVVKGA